MNGDKLNAILALVCGNNTYIFTAKFSIISPDFHHAVPVVIIYMTSCYIFIQNHSCTYRSIDILLYLSRTSLLILISRQIALYLNTKIKRARSILVWSIYIAYWLCGKFQLVAIKTKQYIMLNNTDL
jgi:hypothetical protein